MFSDKHNVNILTSLLVRHGLRSAVLCPGSRNAPLVHNLVQAGLRTFAVTDERSAGFFALGRALDEGPVALCVTSGTALLNLLPAVAEAFYQHVPLVVISADRPLAWIDQQDGQTLPQAGALAPFVLRSVSLPESSDPEGRWFCNRLVNEALLAMHTRGSGPVHVNVPISEPLYSFPVDALPDERVVAHAVGTDLAREDFEEFFRRFSAARRPMVVLGQNRFSLDLSILRRHAVVLSEALSLAPGLRHAEPVLCRREADARRFDSQMQPDFLLFAGGTLVSKRLKAFLRLSGCDQYLLSPSGEVCDTFQHLSVVIQTDPSTFLRRLSGRLSVASPPSPDRQTFIDTWQRADSTASQCISQIALPFSSASVVREFSRRLSAFATPPRLVYGNSSAVRLASLFAPSGVFCNRGVNGIEGSLSTAVGLAADRRPTCCILGDLSFFYDQNALWNEHVADNLRILLLNNGGGAIFSKFEGLKGSPARERFVMGRHHTSARGICLQSGVEYLQASDDASLSVALDAFLRPSSRPMLLEVHTDAEGDWEALDRCCRVLSGA